MVEPNQAVSDICNNNLHKCVSCPLYLICKTDFGQEDNTYPNKIKLMNKKANEYFKEKK